MSSRKAFKIEEFKHNLLHLVSAMILSMQEYEKKICDLIDKEYLKEDNKIEALKKTDKEDRKDDG